MNKLLQRSVLFTFLCISIFSYQTFAQRKVEKLGRGVVAINQGNGKVYISWRLLVSDPDSVGFNVYRSIDGATATKLNTSLIKTTTDFTDNSASTSATNSYFIKPVINGVELAASKSFSLMGSTTAKSYISIPLQPLSHYSVQHIYVGDIDGDGEYDYIVKRLPADSHNNVMLEAYLNDGTFKWRIDLGQNIEQGAPTHNPFVLVYDFDGDGKAEVLTRSSEGTVFADGTTIGDVNGDGISDYRTFPAVSLGYMLLGDNCPEFLSMVDGMTGKEITRTNWIDRGRKSEWLTKWGDEYGHRMSMQFIGVAYLDGIHPSIVGSRGPGELMDIAAWDYSNKQFTSRWTWSSRNNSSIPTGYHWADFHNIRILDLDGDGKDEISYGVNALDDNGTPLYYAKNDVGHGDRFVIADLNPDRPGLECYAIQQTTSVLAVLYDVKNGDRIKTWSSSAPYDVSRGDAADIDPRSKGMELWSYAHNGVLNCNGDSIAPGFPHPALSIWWDGDLLRENLDAADGDGYNPVINKWNYTTNSTGRLLSIYNEGGAYSTKTPYAGRAALYGDIMGDWREEVFCMNSDSTEIRIFSTTAPASTRLYCLMQNPEYRLCVNLKGYLPSTEVDYYLGNGMTTPPTPPVISAKSVWKGGLSSNAWDVGTTANWVVNNVAGTYAQNDTVMFDISGSANTSVNLSANLSPSLIYAITPVDYTFSGTGSFSGATELRKSGNGAVTMNVACDYSGKTKVEQGSLYINNTLSQSKPTVYKNAVIGGSGTIAPAVTLNSGAIVAPGTQSSVGTLTFSSALTLPSDGKIMFDITNDSTGLTKPSDKIMVNGNLTISDSITLVINQIDGIVKAGTYPLITYSGTFSGNLSKIGVSGLYGKKYSLSNSSGVISLTIEGSRAADKIVWGGTNSVWDLQSTPAWTLKSQEVTFVANDSVIFNSTGSNQPNVSVSGSLPIANLAVDNTSNDYTLSGSGVISGTGGLSKSGKGTLTLSTPSNTFTGTIAINTGTLQVNALSNAGTASPIGACTDTIPSSFSLANATLRFTGTGTSTSSDRGILLSGSDTLEISASASATLKLTGRLAGTGTLVKIGSGILMLTPASKNTYSGNTIIKAGTISFGDNIANQYAFGSGTVTLDGGTWSMYNNTSTSDYTSPWNIIVPSGSSGTLSATTRGTLSGSLTGSGTLNINIPGSRTWFKGDWSAFTGQVNVTGTSGAEFRLGNTSKGYASTAIHLGTGIRARYVTSNGSDSYSTNVSIGELSGDAGSYLASDNWTLGAKNTDATFSGTIEGNSMTKVGTGSLTLSGANTYTGATTISAGAIWVTNTSGSGTGTGAVTVNNGATLGGTGIITGTVAINSGATIAPGTNDIGTLTINNAVTLASGSTMKVEINSTAGTFDQLVSSGAVRLNGTLSLVKKYAAAYIPGNSYKIINATTINGSFTTISPSTPGTDMAWDTTALRSSGTITVKGYQTITFTLPTDKKYGDAPFALTATGGGSGNPLTYSIVSGDAVTLSGSTATIVKIGTVQIKASQAASTGYFAATDVTQSMTISQGTQTINGLNDITATWGDADIDPAATATSGLQVTYETNDASIATIISNKIHIIKPGSCTITASQAGNTNYLAATPVQKTLTINKKTPTITFSSLPESVSLDQTDFTPGATSDASSTISLSTSDSNIATILNGKIHVVAIGDVNIIASINGDTYFSDATKSQKLTIGKASQTITFSSIINKTYGDGTFTLTASSDKGLTVTYTSSDLSVVNINGNTATIVGAGTSTITASQVGNASYNSASALQLLTVNKAMLTVTARDTSRYYGKENPAFKLNYTNFKGTDNSSNLQTLPTASCTATTSSLAGQYDITVTGGSDKNYDFSYVSGKLTVVPNTPVETIEISGMSLSPNPTSGLCLLSLPQAKKDIIIEIKDCNGKTVFVKKYYNQQYINLDLSSSPKGLYFLKVLADKLVTTKKILVQ